MLLEQYFGILLKTVIGPEIVKLFAARAAANQPPPTSEEVIALFNQHFDQKMAEGIAFILSKETPVIAHTFVPPPPTGQST